MKKHFKGTPGPWRLLKKPGELFVMGGNGFSLAKINVELPGYQDNAYLIESAPELLKALQAVILSYNEDGHLLNFDVDIARQAINKALGNP